MMENFCGTKNHRKFLEGLKRKVGIFFYPVNIITFRFFPSKNFLLLLVPQKFLITTFSPYF